MNYRSLVLLLSMWVLALALRPATSEAMRIIEPGDTLVVKTEGDGDNADGRGEDCVVFLLGTCQTDPTGDRFGVRTTASTTFNRGQGKVFQYYDFDVDDSTNIGTALLTQISGSAKLNGFMALVGGGQTNASLALKIIDLGPTLAQDPGGGKVIHKETLASHSLQGVAITGLNFGLKVEGGAPYLGAGAGPELKFNVTLNKKVVRDSLDFGFSTVLIRGHSYRLQFELSTLSKKGAVTGTAISQFKLGGPVTDMLNTENWLQGIKDTIKADLPNLKAEVMSLNPLGSTSFSFPKMDINQDDDDDGIFSRFADKRALAGANIGISGLKQNYIANFADTKAFLLARAEDAGLPTSFQEIVEKRFSNGALNNVLEEGIEKAGVEVLELSVTMQEDQVELLREIIQLLKTPQGRRPGFPSL